MKAGEVYRRKTDPQHVSVLIREPYRARDATDRDSWSTSVDMVVVNPSRLRGKVECMRPSLLVSEYELDVRWPRRTG